MGFNARLKYCHRLHAHKEHKHGWFGRWQCPGVDMPIHWCQDTTEHGPHEYMGRIAMFRCLGYPFPHRST